MKPDDIFGGINEIDDELIYEAEAVPAYKRASGRRICAAAAFLILAVGFTVLIHESDTEHLSGIGKNSGIILVDETEYITSETDASREKKTEESVPQTISATAFIPPAASDTENQSIPYEITEAPTSAEEYTNTDDVQGFTSLSSSILASITSLSIPRAFAHASISLSSLGKNSCRGGSKYLTITGYGFISRRMPVKSSS